MRAFSAANLTWRDTLIYLERLLYVDRKRAKQIPTFCELFRKHMTMHEGMLKVGE